MVDYAKIHGMAQSEDVEERKAAVDQIGTYFQNIPKKDKDQAWNDLLALTKDKDSDVRRSAANALGCAFQYMTDKDQASNDLLALTKDKDSDVRWGAADALGRAFQYMTDKDQASNDLLALTKDKDSDVRWGAADALGPAFQYMTDKKQAWNDLLALTKDDDSNVRRRAADALGGAFQYVTDKEQAWKDLLELTKYSDSNVRVTANYSLGKISICRAKDAESEERLQEGIDTAIIYFEKSTQESTDFNPAKFCLPFYRSFNAVIFKKEEAKEEIERNLSEAKQAVAGSESKEKLLKAVENLANALEEAQKLRGLDEIQADLNAYMRYCDRTVELLDDTKDKAPGASELLKKGLPIIDGRIKAILTEIQEKTKALSKETVDTPLEDLGKQLNEIGQGFSHVRDPIGLEESVANLEIALSNICNRMAVKEKGEVCQLLEKSKNEQYVEDKINLLDLVLAKISTNVKLPFEFHKLAEKYKNDAKSQVGEKRRSFLEESSENFSKASKQYMQQGMEVDSHITNALSKSIYSSIENNDEEAIILLEEALNEIDKAIKKMDTNDINQYNRLKGLRFEYLAKKYIRQAIISNENVPNQDTIISDIVDCFVNASRMFEQLEGDEKEYGYICKGCACLYKSLMHLSIGIKNNDIKNYLNSIRTFKKSKQYYSIAKSTTGVEILDKIDDITNLLKEFMYKYYENIDRGESVKFLEYEPILVTIDELLDEISFVGLKNLYTTYIFDEAISIWEITSSEVNKRKEQRESEISSHNADIGRNYDKNRKNPHSIKEETEHELSNGDTFNIQADQVTVTSNKNSKITEQNSGFINSIHAKSTRKIIEILSISFTIAGVIWGITYAILSEMSYATAMRESLIIFSFTFLLISFISAKKK